MKEGDAIDLSLVVLSWNTKEITLNCLDSIFANPPDVRWELILIDNASRDGSAGAIRERFGSDPHLTLIENNVNTGFTGGNNQGMELAKGKIIGLLNSDTIVSPGAIGGIFRYLLENPGVGVAGPMLTHDDGSPTTSFGYFPSAWSIFTTAFLPGWIFGNQRKALGVVPDKSMTKPMEVDYVSGAAFFIKRDVIDKVGKFDQESFFAYYEETDWCLRINKAGWKIAILPSYKIVHLEGQSFEKMTSHRRLIQYDSAKIFTRKHYSLPMVWWYQFCTVIGSLVKVAYFGIRIALQPSRKERWLPHYRWNAFVFDLWKKGLGISKTEEGTAG
ncbi:MAG: glycosyltransferase family 2 protein [bacterium]|nr:glycosyltransferase family 2 protein [bacterium]